MPLLLHVLNHDLTKFKAEGCELADPPELFRLLMGETLGNPCTTGCAYFDNGKCKAYRKYHSDAIVDRANVAVIASKTRPGESLIGGQWKGMTSKQIRVKEGISREEFQIRKQRGDYKQ